MERDSFIFYKSFYEAIRGLPDNIRLEVFTAITEYSLYGKQPGDLKPFARGMFLLIKPNLDANVKRYENGMKGGRKPRKNTPPSGETPGETPAESPEYSSFEEEVAIMKEDQIWWEPVCMQFHIDKTELDGRLDAFVNHCKVERRNELHPSMKEARRHFTSWMRKAYPATERKSTEQPKTDDYTFNGGFGGLD